MKGGFRSGQGRSTRADQDGIEDACYDTGYGTGGDSGKSSFTL